METIIDFDDPSSFPEELATWSIDFENEIRKNINTNGITEGWQIERQLQNLHIDESPLVKDYLAAHMDAEVAVSHCTRILDANKFRKEGLVTGGGRGSIADIRLRGLLSNIGLETSSINNIMSKVYSYWDRDKEQRTEAVHFQFDRNNIYQDNTANVFAINLGGEVIRWALEECGTDLYKSEPYKRLWIWGTPSIVKFKCKLSNVHPTKQAALLAEIVKYNIVTKLYGYAYEFDFTGMTTGSVPPEDIISIEEIHGFIEMQEKYKEFAGFYDELKKA